MPRVYGTLTDFGLESLDGHAPRLYFRPASPGVAGMNILSTKAIEVAPAFNGYFEVELAATATIAPATHYVIQIEWSELPSRKRQRETLPWRLLVPGDGGALGDLLRVPANPALVFTGEEPPALPSAGLWWLDPATGDLAEYDGEGWAHKANLRGPAGYNATDAAADDAAIAAFLTQAGGPTAAGGALESRITAALAARAAGDGRPAHATTAAPFDAATSVYAPARLRKARTILADAVKGTGVFHTMFIGDSNTYGANEVPPYNVNAFPARVRAALDARYASAGTGMVPCFVGALNDSRLTYTGVWTSYRDRGFSTHTARATGTDKKITYGPYTGDGFKVHYLKDATGGTFSIAIDGGAPVTVDSYAATEALATHTITGLTAGAHTAVITAPAAGNASIVAVEGTAAAGAQKVTHAGYSGANISNVSGTGAAGSLATMFDLDAPDLMVLMMEVNDYGNSGTPIETYKTRYRALLARAAAAGTLVLIVAGVPVQAPRTPVGQPAYTAYHKALYELADEFAVPLLDTHHRWGTWAEANRLGVMADDYHINRAGHTDLAAAIAAVIDSGWGAPNTATPNGYISGRWYGSTLQTPTNVVSPNGQVDAMPWTVRTPVTLQAIGVNVTAAGSAGAVVRLGIYSEGPTGNPATLLLDAGTIDATTTGGKSIPISRTLPAGRYWLAAVLQGAPATPPKMWGSMSGYHEAVAATSLTFGAAPAFAGNASTTALQTAPLSLTTGQAPRVAVQIA